MTHPHARNICYDRILPAELASPHLVDVDESRPLVRLRAISPLRKQWVNGSTIKIMLLGGTAAQQALVKSVAPKWTEHANLKFEFVTDMSASQIRVSFDPDDGAWSYVGTDNLSIPKPEATMNLGWVDEAVILHETGHMIGLSHEHQNPSGGITWNEAKVIADLKGAPNYWDEETTRHNVLERYSADQIHGTAFDPASIMLYAFPGDWTLNLPAGTKENTALSAQDKAFVASAKMYPKQAAPEAAAVSIPIWASHSAAIDVAGEADLYRINVANAGVYVVETDGGTDVFMTLFGPDSVTKLVAQDDDSGEGYNARIRAALQPGVYYVSVRHYSPTRTGAYRIRAMRES